MTTKAKCTYCGIYGPVNCTRFEGYDIFDCNKCNGGAIIPKQKKRGKQPQSSSSSLEELLEEWQVMSPGMWENNVGPPDWYAVGNNKGIIAYFGNEKDALRWRLSEINRILNG